LRRALRYGQQVELLEPDGSGLKSVRIFPPYRLVNRVIWAVWNRLPSFAQWPGVFIMWSSIVDRIVCRRLVPSDVFHGLAGSFLASLRKARKLGAFVVIDNSFLHPMAFRREVVDAFCLQYWSGGYCSNTKRATESSYTLRQRNAASRRFPMHRKRLWCGRA
jgi:hypothetical protein